jgi:competence protein ComEA
MRGQRGRLAAVVACLVGLMLPLSTGALDLNTATQADLEAVKGIGPALSQRLLDARAERAFAGWADLQHRVPGVGASTARRWSAQGVTVGGEAYVPAGAASGASGASGASR